LSASNEVNLKELLGLAEHGFLAVGLDNCGHGARRLPDFDQRFANPKTWEHEFLSLVHQTADEVSGLLNILSQRGWVYPGRLGMAGISMGGVITYAAITRDPRISAAATIVATPKWVSAQDRGNVFPTAIFSQTAGLDEVIDQHEAARFHQELQASYSHCPERNVHINYPHSKHMMREEDFHQAFAQMLNFFERFLLPTDE